MKKGDTLELAGRSMTIIAIDETRVVVSFGGHHRLDYKRVDFDEAINLQAIGRSLFGRHWEDVPTGNRIGTIVLGKARGEHAGVHAVMADMFGHGRILAGEIPWR